MNQKRKKLRSHLLPTLTVVLGELRDASANLHLANVSTDDSSVEDRNGASSGSQPGPVDQQQLVRFTPNMRVLGQEPLQGHRCFHSGSSSFLVCAPSVMCGITIANVRLHLETYCHFIMSLLSLQWCWLAAGGCARDPTASIS